MIVQGRIGDSFLPFGTVRRQVDTDKELSLITTIGHAAPREVLRQRLVIDLSSGKSVIFKDLCKTKSY